MLHVEPAPRYRMTAAPLVQAVAQVTFPIVPAWQSLEGIEGLRRAVLDLLPYLNQQVVQEVTLTVGPAGPAAPSAQSSTLWVFTDDAGWTLQVSVGSATLTVDGEHYRGVADFRQRLERVWTALRDHGQVRRCDRLGVRYLDLVELVDDDWARWFRSEVVGLAAPSLSGSSLGSTLTETRLQVDSAEVLGDADIQIHGVIRHGVIPAGSTLQGVPPRTIARQSFLFDMDVSVAAAERFDPVRLAQHFGSLHAELEKVFHFIITEDGRTHFGYELVDETGE